MNDEDRNNEDDVIKEAKDILKRCISEPNRNDWMSSMLYNTYLFARKNNTEKRAIELSCTLVVAFMKKFSEINNIDIKK